VGQRHRVAIAAAWAVLVGVLFHVGFNADDPGLPLLLFLMSVGVTVLGLLMVVMRALLRQATTLRIGSDPRGYPRHYSELAATVCRLVANASTQLSGRLRSLLSGEPRRHPSSRAHLHPMEPLNPRLRSKDGDARALPARDSVDPAAPVDLVQRSVLPVDRVRPPWLATSLLRSRSQPLRCRGGPGRTLLRTCCCLPHYCAGVLSAQRCEELIPGG
jgi:Protein of unknown function (DUF2975)